MRAVSTTTLLTLFLHRCPDACDHGDDTADTGADTGGDTAEPDWIVVTADDPQGWENSRDTEGDGGPCTGAPREGEGSLCLSIGEPTEDASPAYAWSITQDFGLLSDVDGVGFDFYRSSDSTSYGHFAPALILYVEEPADGTTTALIWEAAYNGYLSYSDSVPEDTWVSEDTTTDTYWQWNDGVVEIYDRGLHDWGYSADARVVAIAVQLGSGWNGSWSGYADLVTISVAGERTTWNFE